MKKMLALTCSVLLALGWWLWRDHEKLSFPSPSQPSEHSDREESGIRMDGAPHAINVQLRQLEGSRLDEHQFREQNPNAFYLPGNASEDYSKRFIRHNQISQYFHSPIRNHPSMRQLMMLLLENGHDVFDWVNVVVTLSGYHRPVASARSRFKAAGYYEHEIEMELIPIKNQQQERRARYIQEIRRTTGIQDEALLNACFELEFPLDLNAKTMLGRKKLYPGDRFLTDEDWIEPAFQEAIARSEQVVGKGP